MDTYSCFRWCWVEGGATWHAAVLSVIVFVSCVGARAGDDATIVSIRVIDDSDGKPLQQCVVRSGDYAALAKDAGRTDSDGKYACVASPLAKRVLDSGLGVHILQYDFWVHCPGYVSQHIRPFDSATPASRPIVVRMIRGRQISGRVVRSDDSPVSHEPALLVGNTDDWPVQKQILTDETGRFCWSEAPQGRIYFIMGVDKTVSNAVFRELDISDDVTIVQAPLKWQGLRREDVAKLIYLRHSPAGPILPALWDMERTGDSLASLIQSQRDAIEHVIVSHTDQQDSIDFFGVGGRNCRVQIRGQVSNSQESVQSENCGTK